MGWDRNKRKIRARGVRTSSGVTVDSGGVTVTAGGATIAKGGVTITSGVFKLPYLAAATTVAQLTNQGISHITATTAGKNFVLGLPARGALKVIVPATTLAFTVTCVANAYFVGATGAPSVTRKATFEGANPLLLIGYSSAAWGVLANTTGAVSLGTT